MIILVFQHRHPGTRQHQSRLQTGEDIQLCAAMCLSWIHEHHEAVYEAFLSVNRSSNLKHDRLSQITQCRRGSAYLIGAAW